MFISITDGYLINNHTFNSSTQRKVNKSREIINAVETITSTDLCGPRFFKYERTDSQVFIFLTLFKRKCGNSDFRARLDDVKCENNLAYNKRCLNVRSATDKRKNTIADKIKRWKIAIITNIFSLKFIISLNIIYELL